MSAANLICEICGIRVICESPGSVATPNLRETIRMVICVIRGICVRLFYGKMGWADADAPRRVPTMGDYEGGKLINLTIQIILLRGICERFRAGRRGIISRLGYAVGMLKNRKYNLMKIWGRKKRFLTLGQVEQHSSAL